MRIEEHHMKAMGFGILSFISLVVVVIMVTTNAASTVLELSTGHHREKSRAASLSVGIFSSCTAISIRREHRGEEVKEEEVSCVDTEKLLPRGDDTMQSRFSSTRHIVVGIGALHSMLLVSAVLHGCGFLGFPIFPRDNANKAPTSPQEQRSRDYEREPGFIMGSLAEWVELLPVGRALHIVLQLVVVLLTCLLFAYSFILAEELRKKKFFICDEGDKILVAEPQNAGGLTTPSTALSHTSSAFLVHCLTFILVVISVLATVATMYFEVQGWFANKRKKRAGRFLVPNGDILYEDDEMIFEHTVSNDTKILFVHAASPTKRTVSSLLNETTEVCDGSDDPSVGGRKAVVVSDGGDVEAKPTTMFSVVAQVIPQRH